TGRRVNLRNTRGLRHTVAGIPTRGLPSLAAKGAKPDREKAPGISLKGELLTLPHLWGSTRRRRGKGQLFPIYGEVPAEGGGRDNSSPFMGKYPPKAGKGQLFPIYGEVPAEGGGWGCLKRRQRPLTGAVGLSARLPHRRYVAAP